MKRTTDLLLGTSGALSVTTTVPSSPTYVFSVVYVDDGIKWKMYCRVLEY